MSCECVNVAIGSHANAVSVALPPHMSLYRQARVSEGLSPLISVDRCIVEEVQHLWSLGITTYGSCCGHNVKGGSIVVAPDDHERMLELGYEKRGVEFIARGVEGKER